MLLLQAPRYNLVERRQLPSLQAAIAVGTMDLFLDEPVVAVVFETASVVFVDLVALKHWLLRRRLDAEGRWD